MPTSDLSSGTGVIDISRARGQAGGQNVEASKVTDETQAKPVADRVTLSDAARKALTNHYVHPASEASEPSAVSYNTKPVATGAEAILKRIGESYKMEQQLAAMAERMDAVRARIEELLSDEPADPSLSVIETSNGRFADRQRGRGVADFDFNDVVLRNNRGGASGDDDIVSALGRGDISDQGNDDVAGEATNYGQLGNGSRADIATDASANIADEATEVEEPFIYSGGPTAATVEVADDATEPEAISMVNTADGGLDNIIEPSSTTLARPSESTQSGDPQTITTGLET